jgi:hypothetical protein
LCESAGNEAPAKEEQKMANINTLISKLEREEVTHGIAGDKRRILRDERFSLIAARNSRDPERIEKAVAEAERVIEMWAAY